MTAHSRTPSDMLPGEGPVDRWTPARKQEVLRRIHANDITRGDAMRFWGISVEELDAWMLNHRKAGQNSLRARVVAPVGERLL